MAPPSKIHKLGPADISRVVPDLGACFATDRITVDGAPVGHMYREKSTDEVDSGWRFFSGDESDEYMACPENTNAYDLNTIANYDRDIIPWLTYPPGTRIERAKSGFQLTSDPGAPPSVSFLPPVGPGNFRLSDNFELASPVHLLCRFETGRFILWRAGITITYDVVDHESADVDAAVDQLTAEAPPERTEELREQVGEMKKLSYRTQGDGSEGPHTCWSCFSVFAKERLELTLRFSDTAGEDIGQAVWESVRIIATA
ncbi:MAG: DUF2185 domain-containing protein [Polyangiaceae bacterium]|nr:DUF2185 domain-containing protein [Polyangiaceae bacterium]